MVVHVVSVLIGGTSQLAGVFEDVQEAHLYLVNNSLVGTVKSVELIRKG